MAMKSPRDLYTHPGGGHRRYNGDGISREDIQKLRTVPLVPHGFKCPAGCGSTLVPADPLPHFCGRAYLKRATYSETVIP